MPLQGMSNQHIAKRLPQLGGHVGAALKPLMLPWSVSGRHTVRWKASVARYGFEKLSSRLRKCVKQPCIDFLFSTGGHHHQQ